MTADSTDLAFHDWIVEEREIQRHITRRGRAHAFETIDPARTALVVIDMVPFFVHESAYCRGIVSNINALADGLRQAGGVVAWVVPGYQVPSATDREFFGEVVADSYANSGGDGRPLPGLAIADDDLVVEKTARSAFFPGSSDLPALRRLRCHAGPGPQRDPPRRLSVVRRRAAHHGRAGPDHRGTLTRLQPWARHDRARPTTERSQPCP